MGVGMLISLFIGLAPTFPWTGKRKIKTEIVNVWDLVIFQPTEAYSINYQFFGANLFGHEKIQRFLSTDVNKYKQTVALILEKTKKQMGQKGHHELVPIDEGKLKQIYHTWFGRVPYQLGRFITYAINCFVVLFRAKWYNENEMHSANVVEGECQRKTELYFHP
jgi:hypothetical protein